MIVLDASALIEVLLRTVAGDRIAERIFAPHETLHVPHLLDIEVAQVLRRYVTRKELTADRAREALKLLAAFPMERYPHHPLLERIWQLRANLTAYDAAYVALAEALRAVLLTRDQKIASAPGLLAAVDLA